MIPADVQRCFPHTRHSGMRALVLANCTITILAVASCRCSFPSSWVHPRSTPSVFKPLSILLLFPSPSRTPLVAYPLAFHPRASVVYISGCSEGKTNGILHKYPSSTPVLRNYQTSHPSYPLSWPLSLSLSLLLFLLLSLRISRSSDRRRPALRAFHLAERWMQIERTE